MQPKFDSTHRIFLDTSSLMYNQAKISLVWLESEIIKNHLYGQVIIPQAVVNELKKHINKNIKPQKKLAENGLIIVQDLIGKNIARIIGESDDGYVDNLFLKEFTGLRLKYNLTLITQDKNLSLEILNLNESQAVKYKYRIMVYSLNEKISYGLRKFSNFKNIDKTEDNEFKLKNEKKSKNDNLIFKIIKHSDELENVKKPPVIGDVVLDSQNIKHRLIKLLGQGGEGSAFLTDSELVCKIYNKDKLFKNKINKIELMANHPINHPSICWPNDVVHFDQCRVGYLMKKAQGKEIQKSIFIKPIMLKDFPSWTKLNLVQLCLSILNPIKLLNEQGILLGDINPRNIFVYDEKNVYFVDTDSYQFRGYLCNVGMPPFLSPNLYGKDLKYEIRTLNDEAFAVSTLMFMLMMPGKPPYSHQGGEDPLTNVALGNFPYALGERRSKNAPEGPWRYIWSHLPYYLKEIFDNVFTNKKYLNASEWIRVMERYEEDLISARTSNEIFPTMFKELNKEQTLKKGGRWINCYKCNREFGYFGSYSKGMCQTCKSIQPIKLNQSQIISNHQPAQPFHQPAQPFHQPTQPFHQPTQPFHQPTQPFHQPAQPTQPSKDPGFFDWLFSLFN